MVLVVTQTGATTQDPGQQRLNVAALEALRRGERVVRLKSGDPFVYGRGGEELTFFRANGFEPLVLPGVSSAFAAPAMAHISVTHRGVADQVLVLAAHGRGGAMPDIPAFSATRTLVLLMVAKRVAAIADACLERGYPSALPVAVIERAATPHQRTVRGTLADIGAIVAAATLTPPATVRRSVVSFRVPLSCSFLLATPPSCFPKRPLSPVWLAHAIATACVDDCCFGQIDLRRGKVVICQDIDSCAYQYAS